jgi:hypothetical protein
MVELPYITRDDNSTGWLYVLVRCLLFFVMLVGVAVTCGVLTFFGREPLSHVVPLIAGGLVAIHVLTRLIFWKARCLECGQRTRMQWASFYSSGRLTHRCDKCRIVWDTQIRPGSGSSSN